MRLRFAILIFMTLAGMVFPFWAELSFAAEYQYWMWHERTSGCTMFTQVKNGADILNVTRPIGLTKAKCVELLGPPTAEINRDSDRGPWRELNFQKSKQYDISLFFEADEICTGIVLTHAGAKDHCQHMSSLKAHQFIDKFCMDDFYETSHRQPGYRPRVEYPPISREQRHANTRKLCENFAKNRGWWP